MKIELNLNKSFNHYNWENKEELKEYIYSMLEILWGLYIKMQDDGIDASNEE